MSQKEEKEVTTATAEAFPLTEMLCRLDPGLVSRAQARRMIKSGRVYVDGEVVWNAHTSVRKGQRIELKVRSRRSVHGRYADSQD